MKSIHRTQHPTSGPRVVCVWPSTGGATRVRIHPIHETSATKPATWAWNVVFTPARGKRGHGRFRAVRGDGDGTTNSPRYKAWRSQHGGAAQNLCGTSQRRAPTVPGGRVTTWCECVLYPAPTAWGPPCPRQPRRRHLQKSWGSELAQPVVVAKARAREKN
jgi:hypothetical protein